MSKMIAHPTKKIEGIIEAPGDKSISHRAVMIGAIAEGTTVVENFLMSEDCIRTIEVFRAMGIDIKSQISNSKFQINPKFKIPKLIIHGGGLHGLKKPKKELYLGNSGTTMRIIMGILAGQGFECVLTGDESLSKRPMGRVAGPLRMMGAEIGLAVSGERLAKTTNRKPQTEELYPPLRIKGKYPLKAIRYKLPVASAQVKSAILLAGLYADGATEVEETIKSRDHTERMLKEFGANISIRGNKISVNHATLKSKGEISIPGDISSAAFFIVAAAILKSSKITIKNLGVNPTRAGIIDILKRMGAKIDVSNFKEDYAEPMADVTINAGDLKGVVIEGDIIPRAIDELPILMVAAAFAKGETIIKGAGELRVKETDRISSMSTNLKKMGADVEVEGDTIVINGKDALNAAEVDSFGDHRTAMSMAIAGLRAKGKTTILNTECINKSFPEFENLLCSITSNGGST